MPRLNHKKARTGCQRCKARKVKCDESKPKCAACTRHNVPCEYVEPAPRRTEQHALPNQHPDGYAVGMQPNEAFYGLDPRLEIRLMHQWTAYTCQSFSTAVDFWKCQAPIFAMEHRMVLDAILGLAALHASRQSPAQWIPMEGRMDPIRDPIYKAEQASKELDNHWKESDDAEIANAVRNAEHPDYVTAKGSRELLMNARKYFDRAIDGHTRGINALTKDNIEAVYITSILVSFQALFCLSETDEDATLPSADPIIWLRLADGTRYLCDIWRQMVGEEWLESTGVYFGRPKLQAAEELYQREEGKPFQALLTFAEDYETVSPEDKAVYQQAVASLALIYKNVTEGTEAPLANCRRLVAMPSQLARRFTELVEMASTRALIIMAYMFATMKITSEKVPWFRGIAERQIPRIAARVPTGWSEIMKWPIDIAEGRAVTRSQEEEIREILTVES